MENKLAQALREKLPASTIVSDSVRLRMYGYDGTLYEGMPDLVVLPESPEQAAAAVELCAKLHLPVVPRGAATSLSGGPVPVRGGVVLSMTRMDQILEEDYENLRVTVQPGVVNQDLQAELGKTGFYYAPDPSSQCVCTIGGNIGENSGGPHCLKYGVTVNHITGLKTILPDGRSMSVGGKTLDENGYDLLGLLVGSEGTLAIASEITCKVMPKPETVITMLAIFDDLNDASKAVSDIIAAGIIPATLEMMDNSMIQAVEMALKAGYPPDAGAVLIVELDGLPSSTQAQVGQVEKVCKSNHARSFQTAENEQQRMLLWKGRKGAFGAVSNLAPSKICTDISVPRSELPATLAGVMDIGKRHNLRITNVFHAGDGNLHPLVLYDPSDEDQARRVELAENEITQLALSRGGVLTGEHGIGCCKMKHMAELFGPSELRLMWRIKKAFDPDVRFNPGKILPDESEIPAPQPTQLPAQSFHEAASAGSAPADVESFAQLLAVADRDGARVTIRGGSTKAGPAGGAAVIQTTSLNRIIEYDYINLTLTAQAGVTLPELDKATAEHGQMVAIRPRCYDKATLGGIAATNDAGPHRLLYGAPRDLITGIKAILPSGEIVHFGSSCVKNVAGYAVERLLIGSWGSLAAIAEMTVRVLPRPQAYRTLAVAVANPETVREFARNLMRSPLRPAAVELLSPAAASIAGLGDGWVVLVGLEGTAEEVGEMSGKLETLARASVLRGLSKVEDDYMHLWQRVTDVLPDGPIMKIAFEPAKSTHVAQEISGTDSDAAFRVSLCLGQAVIAAEAASELAKAARTCAEKHGGALFWPRYATGSLTAVDAVEADVSQKIKDAFDNDGTLSF